MISSHDAIVGISFSTRLTKVHWIWIRSSHPWSNKFQLIFRGLSDWHAVLNTCTGTNLTVSFIYHLRDLISPPSVSLARGSDYFQIIPNYGGAELTIIFPLSRGFLRDIRQNRKFCYCVPLNAVIRLIECSEERAANKVLSTGPSHSWPIPAAIRRYVYLFSILSYMTNKCFI